MSLRQRQRGGGEGVPIGEETPLATRLKQLDVFPKVQADASVQTGSGGVISIVGFVFAALLLASEVVLYVHPERREVFQVDTTFREAMRLNINITFPSLPCSELMLDQMDVSYESISDVGRTIYKQRLDSSGARIGGRVNTKIFDDHAMPSGAREGCEVSGFVEIKKVAGNIHFAPGRSFQRGAHHMHDLNGVNFAGYNVTHYIESLCFGDIYPGLQNPLDHTRVAAARTGQHQYYLKVVPTKYIAAGGKISDHYQYTVYKNFKPLQEESHEHGHQGHNHQFVLPGFFLWYDFNPIKTTIVEYRPPFLQFFTQLCAILGGVITITTILNRLLFKVQRISKSDGLVK